MTFSDGKDGSIQWNVRGMRAGIFSVRIVPGKKPEIALRFNVGILRMVGEEAFRSTLAHEYAHAIVYRMVGRKKKSGSSSEETRPHGSIWRNLMILYGHPPIRCHDYPALPVHARRTFNYRCGDCRQEFRLGVVRHERLKKKPGYLVCGKCRGNLRHEPNGTS